MNSSAIGSKIRRRPLFAAVVVGLACLELVACNKQNQQAAEKAPTSKYEVGVVTTKPQTVAITAELPGRISASLVAEVRPRSVASS
ncbi:hypothetical protein [Breoghania sp.]|uniref:hypothetical protein n=1 Tax=Breoghania sp. TaxID=2065378 RepID=UPI003204F908